MRHVSPTVVGYYVYLQPIFATLIELALGQEIPSFLKILAAIFIFSGVFMVNYPGQRSWLPHRLPESGRGSLGPRKDVVLWL